jgi:hypothetical protein
MGISYFKDNKWSDLTRDERFFCSVLYQKASEDPGKFAQWLIDTLKLDVSKDGEWDIGYEVCFYRDFLWQMDESVRQRELPQKRTFDLCLFGESAIIIIEAKVFESFSPKQNEEFAQDREYIKTLPGLEKISTYVVALASSKYFTNSKTWGRKGTLEVFEKKHITWKQVAEELYNNDHLLQQADNLYKSQTRKLA